MKLHVLVWLAIPVSSVLTGCAGVVRELKEDSAIVGATGFYSAIGFDASAENAMMPLPKIKVVYGTTWRVGVHDCVYIATAAGASAKVIKPDDTADAASDQTRGQGETSKASESASSSCIPSVTSDPTVGPNWSRGDLVISASGNEALKAKWSGRNLVRK
jgi:hypothetical protein